MKFSLIQASMHTPRFGTQSEQSSKQYYVIINLLLVKDN